MGQANSAALRACRERAKGVAILSSESNERNDARAFGVDLASSKYGFAFAKRRRAHKLAYELVLIGSWQIRPMVQVIRCPNIRKATNLSM